MKVILVEPRGFCVGMLDEVVRLEAKGARFVESLAEDTRSLPTLFGVRGVAHDVQEQAASLGLPVLDRYTRQGRALVEIGHVGHPEVEYPMRCRRGAHILVESEEDVATLKLAGDAPLAYVTQTTLGVDDTR
jgi:4-hydroxy-3-methylbut-2-en-1-yl diphosphate reductase